MLAVKSERTHIVVKAQGSSELFPFYLLRFGPLVDFGVAPLAGETEKNPERSVANKTVPDRSTGLKVHVTWHDDTPARDVVAASFPTPFLADVSSID